MSVRIGSAVKGWLLIAGGLTGMLLLTYAGVVFGGQTFVLRDALRFTLPSREFLARSLSEGRLPEWFDGVGFGVAFAANPVHGVLSPLFWPLALSPSLWAFDALTLAQLLILAIGTAALARKLGANWTGMLFSGLVLVVSGYVVSAIPNGNVPYLVWIPWIGWSALMRLEASAKGELRARTRAGALFAAAVALQLLSGEPGHAFIAVLLALALVLVEGRPFQRLSHLLLPATAGALLATAGVLPALILFGRSARARLPLADPLHWSMHPGRILEWVWPLAYGSEGSESWYVGSALHLSPGDPCFVLSLYVGVPVILLALDAGRDRRVRRLLFASVAYVILALGSYLPIYRALRFLLPPLRFVNFPEKFLFGAVLLWCVSAGVGYTNAFGSAPPRRWLVLLAASAGLLAAEGLAVYLSKSSLQAWLAPRAAGVNLDSGLTLSAEGAGLAALGAALLGAALVTRRGSPMVALSIAYTAVFLPLVFSARAITPLAPRTLMERRPRVLEVLPRPPLGQRDVRPRLFLFPAPRIRPPLTTGEQIARDIHETLDTNVASRFGYDIVPGFETGDSALSRRLWEEISPRMSFVALVRLFGVDFAMIPDPERFAPGLPVLARLPGWGIIGTFPVRPRAFVAPRATPARSADEGLESLTWHGREGDPARVIVSGTGAEALDVRGPLEPCLVRSPRPEEVSLDCRSPNGGYAVLLDENLPGWSAELDGLPAKILTADGLFRAVRVSSGEHRIAFRYRTPGLRLGVALSVLTLAAIAGSLVRAVRGAATPEAG